MSEQDVQVDTVVEYRERLDGGALSRGAAYEVGHFVRLNDGEVEWNADLFDITIKDGVVKVLTKPLYESWNGFDGTELVAAYGPGAWLKYERRDYTK